MIKQTRIFAPFSPQYGDNWAENIMGRIIKPVSINPNLEWFWFSRYSLALVADIGDCNPEEVVGNYINNDGFTRSLRFRFSIPEGNFADFEAQLRLRIGESDCFITDFRDYNMVGDVGDNRHLGGVRSEARKIERATLITHLYHRTSVLTLDSLEVNENDDFRMENNDSTGIGESVSSFAVPHHLFCNTTGIPLHVFLRIVIEAHNIYVETRTISKEEEPGWSGYSTTEEQVVPIDKEITVPIKF